MSSLLLVMLLTIGCVLFPPSATAQSQSRNASGQARTQIAFKAPSSSQTANLQQNFAYPAATQGADLYSATSASNNPGWSNQSFDYSNGVSPSGDSSGDTWTADQSGAANGYNYSSASQAAAQNANGRGYDRVYDTYAMSAADVLAARRAVLNGSFFSYHGTQSSQTSRNR